MLLSLSLSLSIVLLFYIDKEQVYIYTLFIYSLGLGDGGGTPLGHREGVVRELFYGVPSIGVVVLAVEAAGIWVP